MHFSFLLNVPRDPPVSFLGDDDDDDDDDDNNNNNNNNNVLVIGLLMAYSSRNI
jgi:hypothetical protein